MGETAGVWCRVMGQIEVRVDGVPVDVGPARRRSVLACLLVEANQPMAVEQLVHRVWGERPPGRARETLYSYVSRLRTGLAGIEDIRIRPAAGGYTLAIDPDDVDLHRFRRLAADATEAAAAGEDGRTVALCEEALGLWRGEMCGALDTPWLAPLRQRLRDERLAVQFERADAMLRLGRHATLLPEVVALADEHPLDERVAGALMLTLHRCERQADALAVYDRARRLLAEELGVDPGPRLAALHERLLRGEARPPAPTPAGRAREHELPADLPDFTGRRAEVEQLVAMVTSRETASLVAAVDGMAGVGKTALAVHVAHRLADRYPDAQLFVDLRGHTPGHPPLEAADALGLLLRALGLPGEQIPAQVTERAALWRSTLARRRVLVLLDNAAGAAQVRPLLPGAGRCLALVTSRGRLVDLDPACALSLDTLTHDEAVALFTGTVGADRAGSDPAAVREAVNLCGHLPLAVRIAAARLRSRPAWSPRQLVERLARSERKLIELTAGDRSVPAAFSLSYDQLPPGHQHVFRLLALHPGPDFDTESAAALAAVAANDAQLILEDLLDVHLLRQETEGRYRFHDLVRLYAGTLLSECGPPPVQREATRRLLHFLLHTAHAADRVLDPHGEDIDVPPPPPGSPRPPSATRPEALRWLGENWSGLLAAQRLAEQQDRPGIVWRLSWVLDGFLMYSGRLHENLASWQRALAANEHEPDPAVRSRLHRRLGRAHAQAGQHDQAGHHLRRALALAEEAGDTTARAGTHYTLALAWQEQGDDHQALHEALRALRLYRELGDPIREARIRNAIGWYHARLHYHTLAWLHCALALAIFRAHHNLQGEADTLDSLAYIAHHTGQHRAALAHYRQALALYRELGDAYSEASTLHRLGDLHAARSEPTDARRTWHQARDLYQAQQRTAQCEQLDHQLRNS